MIVQPQTVLRWRRDGWRGVVRKNIPPRLERRGVFTDFREAKTEGPMTMNTRLSWLKILGDMMQFVRLCFRSRTSLAAENLLLRKQLAFYRERKIKPRRADNPTRVTLALLSRWFDWRDALTMVRPKTLVAWHRKGFRLLWRWKSRSGRRPIPFDLQCLIRSMARDSPSWSEERITNELLLKLGLRVSPRTIRKYLPKLPAGPPARPAGQPGRQLRQILSNHAR